MFLMKYYANHIYKIKKLGCVLFFFHFYFLLQTTKLDVLERLNKASC